MRKNITLSADSELIRKARLKAQRQQTTLNACFRQWLEQYANGEQSMSSYQEIMDTMEYVDAGNKFSRNEMNER
jgi:hypothetical protein